MEVELSGRLGSLSRTIDHLALEKQSIEIPDYSPTLAKMGGHLASIAAQTEAVQESPALKMIPESMAERIATAAEAARETDKATIKKSQEVHAQAYADLKRATGTVRTRQERRWQMLCTGIGTALAVSLVWLVYPGWAPNIGPQSWHWPERVAGRTIGEPTLWDAGIRLMRA